MQKPACIFGLFFLLCIMFRQPASASDAAYEQRRNEYIDSALTAAIGHKIIFQAFRNVPVDSALLNNMLSIIPTKTTSDFDIIQLIRILFLTNGQYDSKILPVLYSVPYWVNYNDTVRNYWSENHMIMWMGSDWLLHEKYNKPIDATLRKRLVHYLELKNQFGFYEFNSNVYAPFSLSGLLNLSDFAQDTVIKNGAAAAAQKLLRNMLLFTNDLGVLFPVAGRNYPGQYINPFYQNINGLIYLLTGKGAPDNFTTAAAFLASSALEVDTVINSRQPEAYTSYFNGHTLDSGFVLNNNMSFADRVVFQWSSGAYFHPSVVSSTVQVLNDSALWNQVDFSLLAPLRSLITPADAPVLSETLGMASKSTVISEAYITLFKHNSITLSSVRDFWKGKAGYQQYPCVANAGTTAVYTGSGEVFANWEDRSPDVQNTHLPYVSQKQNVALIMYRHETTPSLLPAYFRNKDVALHWRDADFNEIVEDGLWLMGRQQDRYVAVRRSCIGEINGVRACPAAAGQSWVIVVGDSAMYQSFGNFQDVISEAQYQEAWYYDSSSAQSVYFASVDVDTIHLEYAWGVDSISTLMEPQPGRAYWNLYPNPVNDYVEIRAEQNEIVGNVAVYSSLGEIVHQSFSSGSTCRINTSRFPSGFYLVKAGSHSRLFQKVR